MEELKIQQDVYRMLLLGVGILFMLSTTSAAYHGRSNQLYNTTCRKGKPEDCNRSETYLECVYDKCVCAVHASFDDFEGVCKIKYPSQCKISNDPWGTKSQPQPCVKDAMCAYPKDQYGNDLKTAVDGICQCRKGRHPTPDGTCSSGVSNMFSIHYSLIFVLCYIILRRCWIVSR